MRLRVLRHHVARLRLSLRVLARVRFVERRVARHVFSVDAETLTLPTLLLLLVLSPLLL